MKKSLLIYYIIICLTLLPYGIVKADTTNYARITGIYSYIYKTPTDDSSIDNIYCYGENTYFVQILAKISDFYKVNYNGITGYIKSDKVECVLGTPLMPYPSNISIITKVKCNLRENPKVTSNNTITTIPQNASNITFLGRTQGEEVVDFGGTTWYYIEYNGYRGYIYNKYIDSISAILPNSETLSSSNTIDTPINPITDSETIVYIIALSIPFVIVLCILYIPTKSRDKKIKHKN